MHTARIVLDVEAQIQTGRPVINDAVVLRRTDFGIEFEYDGRNFTAPWGSVLLVEHTGDTMEDPP